MTGLNSVTVIIVATITVIVYFLMQIFQFLCGHSRLCEAFLVTIIAFCGDV